ncbi:helix-turn-helix domain-containing protein [Alteromonas lipolytica]|uniref:helix-turn-helix domain-containing protein n=1 Tax=Alteromonas lipolytica TaxID=1856405 RepID=UPI001586823E|nr:transcriptional regulator [Alteromonas lipolytica]
MDASDIEKQLIQLTAEHLRGNLSRGQLLKALRKNVLRMTQIRYCKLTGIGRNALIDIERDQGEPTEAIVNKAFAPFKLQPVMVRPDIEFLRRCIDSTAASSPDSEQVM